MSCLTAYGPQSRTSSRCRQILAFLGLMTLAAPGAAADFSLTYFRVEDTRTAEEIERLSARYDERERPLRDRRRATAFGSPQHEAATNEIDRLRAERDAEFLRALADVSPTFNYTARVQPRERNQDSRNVAGKPLRVEVTLREPDNAVVSLDLEVHYDGNQLYRGRDVTLLPDRPHLLMKGFVRTDGGPQGSLLFVRITR
jgi:hypothetical protein